MTALPSALQPPHVPASIGRLLFLPALWSDSKPFVPAQLGHSFQDALARRLGQAAMVPLHLEMTLHAHLHDELTRA